MPTQMRNVIQDLTATDNIKGRASNDLRNIQNFLVLAIASTPQKDGEATAAPRDFGSITRRLDMVVFSKTAGLRIYKNISEKRLLIRTGQAIGDFKLLTKRDGFNSKVPPAGQLVVTNWARYHHLVVHSPNRNDTVKVRVLDEEAGQLKEVLKNKIIFQCSIRELYNDLYTSGIGLVGPDVEYSVLGENGERILCSDLYYLLG